MARRKCDQWNHDRCQIPREIAFDPENDGWFEVDDSTVCGACAELDRYEKEHEKNPPEPGTLLRVIYTRPGHTHH